MTLRTPRLRTGVVLLVVLGVLTTVPAAAWRQRALDLAVYVTHLDSIGINGDDELAMRPFSTPSARAI